MLTIVFLVLALFPLGIGVIAILHTIKEHSVSTGVLGVAGLVFGVILLAIGFSN